MHYLKRLKTILRFSDISGLIIYIPISIILILLSLTNRLVLIFYIIYLTFLYKRSRILFLYSLVLSIIFFLVYIIFYYWIIKVDIAFTQEGIVTLKSDNYILIKKGLNYLKVYINKNDLIEIGDNLKLSLKRYTNQSRSVENTFLYNRYLYSKRIIGEFKLESYEIKNNNFNIYKIKKYVIDYIEKNHDSISLEYIKRLTLGIKEDDELSSKINELGLIYLFSISGLHLSLLKRGIEKIFNKLNIPIEITHVFNILFFLLYKTILSTSSSISRAIIMIIIYEGLLLMNKRMMRLDVLSITLMINLLFNPFSIFATGFYLTYLSTFIIYLNNDKGYIKLSLSIILFSLPLIIYKNKEAPILIILYSLIFGFIFSKFLITFTYITLFIPKLNFFYKCVLEVIDKLYDFFLKFNYKLNFSIINIYFLLLIYIVLLILYKYLKNKEKRNKILFFFTILLSLNYFFGIYSITPLVKIIDVGQGDSILLRDKFYNILIDTGDNDNYDTIINYLKSQNIRRINSIFISHFDSDHYMELDDIKEAFIVDNIYSGLNDLEFNYGNIYLKCFSYNGSSKNDSSMVIYSEIFNKSFLFTGDIESEGEDYIINKLDKKITFLKVAHHGSSTSSKIEFLNKFKPRISLISCGLNNIYGHPDKEVIKRLEDINSIIYRTDLLGSINVYVFKPFSYIDYFNERDLFSSFNYSKRRIILN